MNRMAWRMKFQLKLDQVPTKYPQGSPAGDRGQPSPVMSTELAAGRSDGSGSAMTGGRAVTGPTPDGPSQTPGKVERLSQNVAQLLLLANSG